jgi:cation:H+ antiporter
MFEQFGLLGNAVVLLVSLLVLSKASDSTITNSIRVADITGLSQTTVGFILVAFSTSLPELFVAVFSVIHPDTIGVSIGNVLGSNIVNICLILGTCFLLLSFKNKDKTSYLPSIAREDTKSLNFGLFAASIVPLTLLYVGYASQFIGIILLVVFIFYLYQLSKVRKTKEEGSLGEETKKLRRYGFLAFLGAVGVVVCAFFIVESASYLASSIGIPKVIIGATVVAFGTSVPELATSVGSVRKGHLDLALGNIVGSCFINITCILGVTLVASPFRVNMAAFADLAIFSLIVNVIFWYMLSNERVGWREGAILLFLYTLFLVTSFSGYRF